LAAAAGAADGGGTGSQPGAGPIEPGPIEPGPIQPGPIQPGPLEPGPIVHPGAIVHPGPIRPEPVEPGPIVHPGPVVDPGVIRPTPVDPTPVTGPVPGAGTISRPDRRGRVLGLAHDRHLPAGLVASLNDALLFAPAGGPVDPAVGSEFTAASDVAADALVSARGRPDGVIFRPPGSERPIDGNVVVRGGSVVISSDVVSGIVDGGMLVKRVDDSSWSRLQQAANVPAVVSAADPINDAGSRLDAVRQDPAALTALAEVAGGFVDSTIELDRNTASLVTGGAGAAGLASLTNGTFSLPGPRFGAVVTGPADLVGARDLVNAAATAFDRMVTLADAPQRAVGPVLDLRAARTGLLGKTDPEITVAARIRTRLDIRVVVGVARRDELDPVMASPQFNDPMWQALRDLGHGWLLPGLEEVPPDTATLVRTNPSFVAAHLVGLNHELMRELLWREYPTDRRGTGFRRFWGRTGAQPDDIGPVHGFNGDLGDNLLSGRDGETVLLLRSELLRRYPGSIIYLSRATQQGGNLALDDGTLVLPVFRGDLPPDVTFVGFPISPETLRAPGDPWWFVIAQPPSEPRFGLDEPSAPSISPPPPAPPSSANELAWSHMSPDGNPATTAPFAPADPPALRGRMLDGVTWGASASVQAHLTYQHPVRVAIRAADLLPPPSGGTP
jgi:hypothetical protein